MEAAKLLSTAGRRKAGEFLAEGPNSVRAALSAGKALELFATAAAAQEHQALVERAQLASVPVRLVDERAARKLTDAVSPVALVARCPLLDRPLAEVLAPPAGAAVSAVPRLIAVLVEPADPGNLGTVLRAAHAFGADAFVVLGDGVDPHNPKAVRSSAGSVFAVPFARERDVLSALTSMRASGLRLIATTADGELALDQAGDVLVGPCAWLFGTEAHGLPHPVADTADHRIAIPMRPAEGLDPPESLNLAVAAGVCLYESARARLR